MNAIVNVWVCKVSELFNPFEFSCSIFVKRNFFSHLNFAIKFHPFAKTKIIEFHS